MLLGIMNLSAFGQLPPFILCVILRNPMYGSTFAYGTEVLVCMGTVRFTEKNFLVIYKINNRFLEQMNIFFRMDILDL